MKLENLSAETLNKIKPVRWDRIIEKHEGPENWESVLRYSEPEFIEAVCDKIKNEDFFLAI